MTRPPPMSTAAPGARPRPGPRIALLLGLAILLASASPAAPRGPTVDSTVDSSGADAGDGPVTPGAGGDLPTLAEGAVPGAPSPGEATATALPADPPPAWSLAFVPDAPMLTADGGIVCTTPESALGRLDDTTIAWVTPGAGGSAVKALARTELAALLEDFEGDGQFWPPPWDEIDALGFKRASPPFPRLHTGRLLLSTENGWGGAEEWLDDDGDGALDGTVFQLRRAADGLTPEVGLFLPEQVILRALGPGSDPDGSGVDVDAFTQDVIGNVFLSFRSTEWVGGVALQDEGVVCLPATGLLYDYHYDIVEADEGCAVVVLDRARVDALVEHAGVLAPDGQPITALGDLQALELDPGGGTFDPVQPVPGLEDGVPHLLFNGQKLGPTVLSTRNGGSLAVVDGVALGSSPVDGGALGLDPEGTASTSADLAGLLLFPATPPPITVDATWPEVDLAATQGPIEFAVGNATPGGAVLLRLGVAGAWPLDMIPSVTAPPSAVYPDLLVPVSAHEEWIPADENGRLLWTLQVPSPALACRVVAQAFDAERGELSAPSVVWCPFP